MDKKILLQRVCVLGLALCGAIAFYYLVSPSPTGNADTFAIITARAESSSFPDAHGSLETGKLDVTARNISLGIIVIMVVVIVLYTILFKPNMWKIQPHSQQPTRSTMTNTNSNEAPKTGNNSESDNMSLHLLDTVIVHDHPKSSDSLTSGPPLSPLVARLPWSNNKNGDTASSSSGVRINAPKKYGATASVGSSSTLNDNTTLALKLDPVPSGKTTDDVIEDGPVQTEVHLTQ